MSADFRTEVEFDRHERSQCEQPAFERGSEQRAPTVLIVDSAAPSDELSEGLMQAGYQVLLARDADAARSVLAAKQPEVALIELHVGSVSALDLLAEIGLRSPGTKTAIVTLFGSIESVRVTMSRGATDYFTKPVTADEIIASLGSRKPSGKSARPSAALGIEAMRKRYIEDVLEQSESLSQASRLLHVERRSLRRMLRRLADEA